MSEKDELFTTAADGQGGFVFDERVAMVFPDMIQRSVPGYALVVSLTGLLARNHARENSCLYDLGCSLGATTLAMRHAVETPGVRIVAVDASAAMVQRCQVIVAEDESPVPVELVHADMLDVPIENASVVAMNFTLQFVEPGARLALLRRIAKGLHPGGALILSEKIHFPDSVSQVRQSSWHHDFKRARGYSELEIARKRTALENVLRTDTETEHERRLRTAGFSTVKRWFQCFNFMSFLAIR